MRDNHRVLRKEKEHGTLRAQAVCELLVATAIREDELVHVKLEDLELGERRG